MNTVLTKNITEITKDCIVCALGPIFLFGKLVGVFPLKYRCHHSHETDTGPYFKTSRFATIYSILLEIVLLWYASAHIVLLTRPNEKDWFVGLVLNFMFIASAFLIIGDQLLKRNQRALELNGWVEIMQHKNGLNGTLLEKQTIRQLRFLSFVCCALIIAIEIIIACDIVYISEFKFYHLCILIVNGVVFGTITATPFLCLLEVMLVRLIFKKLYLVLMNKMQKHVRLLKSAHLEYNKEVNGLKSLKLQTENIRRLHGVMYQNWKLTSTVFSAFLLIYLSIPVYSITLQWYRASLPSNTQRSWEMHVQLLAFLMIIAHFLKISEQLSNSSEDILAFLFKYPISKLTPSDANQVESLITTLIIQKPVLRASDIFTVDTKLLASIAGTVVTYVLVALQFHPSWVKDKMGHQCIYFSPSTCNQSH